LSKLIVFLVVIFAFLALGWMLFLPLLVSNQLRKRTGFDSTIVKLVVNPLNGSVEMRGLVVTNPPTFSVPDFLDLREFSANAESRSLFSGELKFDTMVVNIASITLVKREDGTTNAEAFHAHLENQGDEPTPPSSRPRRQVLIRKMDLRIDRLVVVDQTLHHPSRREFTLNIHQHYADVSSIDQLMAPAVLKDLAPVANAVGGLVSGSLGKALTDAGQTGVELLREAGRRTGSEVKGFFDALEESKKP